MKKNTTLFIGAILITFLLVQCKNASTSMVESKKIKSSFKAFDIEKSSYAVDADKGGTIVHSTGSKIHIKPGIFIDKNGARIKSKVEIQYREFHTIADIITAGIPMYHEENGETGYLQTAGMCEIRATADGEEVFIAKGQKIQIDMASHYEGNEEVGFYELDEKNGNWTLTGQAPSSPNPEAVALDVSIDSLSKVDLPVAPRAIDPNEPMIDFNISKSVTGTNLDFALWRNAGANDDSNPLKKSAFREGRYKLNSARLIDRDLAQVKATFYIFTTKNDSEKIEAVLTPVVVGKELNNVETAYQKRLQQIKNWEKRRDQLQTIRNKIASIFRPVNVSNFGYFNCDVFSRNAYQDVKLTLLDNKGNVIDSALTVFLIRPDGVLPTRYNGANQQIRLFANGSMHLAAVIAGGTLALIDNFTNNKKVQFGTDGIRARFAKTAPIDSKNKLEEIIAGL